MAKSPKVCNGNLIPVVNLKRKISEKRAYMALWVEDQDGKNERCLLLTPTEWSRESTVVLPAFSLVKGRLYPMTIHKRSLLICRVVYNGADAVLCLTAKRLARYEARARKNPEDIPVKGLVADLLD